MTLNTKQEIVDWLINNDSFMIDMVQKVNARLNTTDPLFSDDIKEQFLDEMKQNVANEITFSLGTNLDDLNTAITDEMLYKYLQQIDFTDKK
jgi:hypothetical protein